MLCLEKDNQLTEGIQFPHSGPEIFNIQYADDTLLFLTSFDNCIINLKRILFFFQACFGLKINFSKSSLTGIGISDLLTERYSAMLGCSKISLPISYLGLLLHFKKASFNDWGKAYPSKFCAISNSNLSSISSICLPRWRRKLTKFEGDFYGPQTHPLARAFILLNGKVFVGKSIRMA